MVNEKIILQVLTEQQAEIANTRPAELVPRREESLFEFDSSLAQVVIGVRRSGKSTLCHKVLKGHGVHYGYANLDDDRLADMTQEDLNTLLSCIYQIYGSDIPYIFLDEIQDVDGWHLFVNRLLRTGLRVFVTGSNAKLLSSELATYLTGRYNEIRLFPFSFSEYCDYHHIDTLSITTKADADRKRAFFTYIQEGGFPEMQKMRNKRAYVQSLIEAVIGKDVQKRFKIRDKESLRLVANHLIDNACQEVNYGKLANILCLSDKTIKKYVGYLSQAFLVQMLQKFSYKSTERTHNSKSYIVDPGLRNNRMNALVPDDIGWRLENVVYFELLRRSANYYRDIYYYKPGAKAKEIDFVICERTKVIEMIQVAYEIDSPKAWSREVSSLIKASTNLNCSNLTIITFSQSREIVTEGKIIHIKSALDWLLQAEA